MSGRANRFLFHSSGRLTVVGGVRIAIWDGHWTSSIHRMGQPIDKLAGVVDLVPSESGESVLGLDGFPTVVEGQEFLEVSLYDGEAGVDGWVAKGVGEEGEVVRPGYGLLGSLALMLLGPSTAFSIACSSEITSLLGREGKRVR